VANDLFLSNSDFPTRILYNILKKDKNFTKKYFNNESSEHISYENFKRRAIALNIYYPQLKFNVISELAKITIPDLLSGIGGTFGLFLGLSIRRLIKILEKLVIKLINFCKRNLS
jgi:hypothetical protein